MPDLFWPGNPVLLSVHPAEEWVVALRTRLHDAMTRTCQPLQVSPDGTAFPVLLLHCFCLTGLAENA